MLESSAADPLASPALDWFAPSAQGPFNDPPALTLSSCKQAKGKGERRTMHAVGFLYSKRQHMVESFVHK